MNDRLSLTSTVQALLSGYTQHDRLLRLSTPLGPEVLLAERVQIDESISPTGGEGDDGCGFQLQLTALSADAHIELKQLIGQPVLLELLTQASRSQLRPFHGHVTEAAQLGADGGLARYRLTVRPWLAFLGWRTDSRVFQDHSVIEIVEHVFTAYQAQGRLAPAWRWDLADPAAYPRRSLCIQYQESDLAFVQRLLREEGLFCWFEHEGDAGSDSFGRHTLVIADHNGAFTPNAQARVRYTQPGATLKEDSLRHWSARRSVQTAAIAVASWDYRSVGLRPATAQGLLPGTLPADATCTDVPGVYAYEDSAQGERLARCQQEALDAAAQLYTGSGTVRSLSPGTTVTLLDHPHHSGREQDRFVLLKLRHRARNNLSADHRAHIAALFGRTDFDGNAPGPANDSDEPLYDVQLTAVQADVPVRAPALDNVLASEVGPAAVMRHPRPTVRGTQTAVVVGLQAPVHTDRDHRIKVQFHWQRGGNASHRLAHPQGDNAPASDASGTWVRVATSVAGANWGSHFVPRVGQEVLIAFLDGDIDRPVCVGSLYNGIGQDNSQGNQVAGGAAGATGNAPAWFPGSRAAGQHQGHQHAAVMAGFKTQELHASAHGAGGYNQLVFDDSPQQGRIQLATTTQHSQLNLGHAIHQQDNQRLHHRGHGAELTTLAQGAIRAGSGLLLSAHARAGGSTGSSHQLDSREAEQQLQQAAELTTTLIDTAHKHKAKLEAEPAPKELPVPQAQQALKASLEATDQRGHAGSSGDERAIDGGAGTVKAWSRPDIVASAPAGIGVFTPAHAIWYAGKTLSLVAGHDLTVNAQRDRSLVVAQGIVWFTYGKAANANKPNQETGIKLHAGTGSVAVQAQDGSLKLTADQAIDASSTHDSIQMGAPQHVLLTAGGSALKIEGGNITLTTPGAALFKASMKELTGPKSANSSADLPEPGALAECEWSQS
ncbi:type VI secretion system tip protein VgrG [Schlegelella sp. S2-27]|uniref:Type VI secretion system tip protein VgrG n=1 Tax=Caldimonas mangrovi TaxID=2944811 RepID=A0ABT0YMX2_9BURK|nr:type VI secretion system Vgr family protein [Caldimonas mangrovi]MCM5679714.1 type VI secretion system tip protein VgrG [Caldimonas mangrovi]